MPAQNLHLEAAQDLALLLGPRQADIMRLLWMRGPATVREIHTWLIPSGPIAYTTVMTICVRLADKGLLEKQRLTAAEKGERSGKAYL
jgi:predicted transcriptional regulator